LHIFAFLPLGDQRIALKFLSLCQETSLSYHGLLPETHKIIRNSTTNIYQKKWFENSILGFVKMHYLTFTSTFLLLCNFIIIELLKIPLSCHLIDN
jgi:hypothetical protein